MSRIVLFGTGRGADIAYRFMSKDTDHEIVAFTVDEKYLKEKTFHGKPVVPWEGVERAYPPESFRMLILLGYQRMNALREQKYLEAKRKGYTLESYVASDIFRVEDIKVGENCFILDNQSISLDVTIGNNVVMYSSNHIGDHTRIEDHAWVSSGITVAAGATIGQRAFIGIGATVGNNVRIAPDSFIGPDVLLTADTEPGGVYMPGADGKAKVDSRAFMRVMMAQHRL